MLRIKDELNNIFGIVLKVPPKKNKINLNYRNVEKWDSLNHVKLILLLESKFKIKISSIDSLISSTHSVVFFLDFLSQKRCFLKKETCL